MYDYIAVVESVHLGNTPFVLVCTILNYHSRIINFVLANIYTHAIESLFNRPYNYYYSQLHCTC